MVGALRGYAARPAPLVGGLVVPDTDLPHALDALTGAGGPTPSLVVRVTGGAGQLAGPAALCARRGTPPARVQVVLRDLDDLAGNARRVVAAVDAARATGDLDEETVVTVGLPHVPGPPGAPAHGWLAAADEVAAAELALALPTCATASAPAPAPATVVGWLDAALDRELPVTCAADGGTGAAGLLLATRLLLDGEAVQDVVEILPGADRPRLRAALDQLGGSALGRTRRWLLAVGVDDPQGAAEELRCLLGDAR